MITTRRCSDVHHSFPSIYSDSASGFAYKYDSLGHISSLQSAWRNLQKQLSYDSLGRLKSTQYRTQPCQSWPAAGNIDSVFGFIDTCVSSPDSTHVFTYDQVGNRTDQAYIYTDGNRVIEFGNLTFQYDADGNITQKTNSSSGLVWRYHWDALNRLTSVVRVGGDSITYEYSAFGKLVRRKSNGVIDRHWVYTGDHIAAELDGSQRVLVRYAYRPGVDNPLASMIGAGSTNQISYMVLDELGNVTGQLGYSGLVTQEVTYNPWGKPTIHIDSSKNRLLWKGLMYQEEPGLYYVRNRWYDPEIGRFMSEDPIGVSGGINLYIFGNSDPANSFDPNGLRALSFQERMLLSDMCYDMECNKIDVKDLGYTDANRNNFEDRRDKFAVKMLWMRPETGLAIGNTIWINMYRDDAYFMEQSI